MTLIEVMIVVTIMGLLSGAIAIGVTHQLQEARIKTSVMDAKTMRPVAALWRSDHPEAECPTPQRLREDKLLDVASKLTDAWGSPFVIVCEAEETSVVSPGPDRKPNTDDDLREPDPDHGKVAARGSGTRLRRHATCFPLRMETAQNACSRGVIGDLAGC